MKAAVNVMLNRSGNLLLLLLGIESVCLLFCDSFDLPFNRSLGLWLAVISLLLWIASCFRRGILIGFPLSAVAILFLIRQSGISLTTAFRSLADQLASSFYSHFSGGSSAAVDAPAAESCSMALLLVFVLLAGFLSYSLASASFRISLSRLATLPFFLVCILVNGTPPVLPTLGILLFWLGLQLSGDSYRENDGAGKSLLLGIPICALVLLGLLLLYRPATYHYDERDISLSQQFDRISNTLSNWIGAGGVPQDSSAGKASGEETSDYSVQAPAGWSRNQEILDLSAAFDYSALSRTALTLHTDASGSIYLRGRAYGEYTGSAWTAAVENTHASALNYTAHCIAASAFQEAQSFQVYTPAVYDILYLPYFTITGGTGDVFVPSDELKSYGGDFSRSSADLLTLQRESLLPEVIAKEEKQYREFVHSYYTRLPDSTRSILISLCQEHGFSKDNENIISAIADFVRNQGIYDLSVGAFPANDYVVYFLTESHHGYCIHYASAAVALFRALGIPARICEGYLVNSSPFSDTRVTGENAHAWAEVYQDGIGWIPVEVTATEGQNSFTQEAGGPVSGEIDMLPLPIGEDPAVSDPDILDEGEDEGIPDAGEATNPDDDLQSDDQNTEEDSDKKSAEHLQSAVRTLLLIIGIPIVIVGLLYGRYRLLRLRYERKLSRVSGNEKAILAYQQALKIADFGSEVPSVMRTIAEKAAFSQHELSTAEVETCLTELNTMIQNTDAALTNWQKFSFHYLYGLR